MRDLDDHRYHHLAGLVMAIGVLVIAICCVVLVAWMVTAQQTTKLYEADNVVCASQPFALQCFERKPR